MAFFNKDKIQEFKKSLRTPVKEHTILLVDDEEINLRSLEEMLKHHYHLLFANNGQEALELIKNDPNPERIHLIISDQRMPHLTGLEFLKRTIPLLPKTIRIIVTGYMDTEVIMDSINESNVYKLMTKPFEPENMLMTVKHAVEMYELGSDNVALIASKQHLNELTLTRDKILRTLNQIHKKELVDVLKSLEQGIRNTENFREANQEATRILQRVQESLAPISELYFSIKALEKKAVLFADSNQKQHMIAKIALERMGVNLDIVSDLKMGRKLLAENRYDLLCVNTELIQLAPIAYENHSNLHSVLITSEEIAQNLSMFPKYPMLSNIVSHHGQDHTLTLKSISTTVSKLLHQNLFGLEKYLQWGVQTIDRPITSDIEQQKLIDEMQHYFASLGIEKQMITRCSEVSAVMLTNPIYDVPTDENDKSLHPHLSRVESFAFNPKQQGVLRYASDGFLIAVSVEDSLGTFSRETMLKYLEKHFLPQHRSFQFKERTKIALLQIMQRSDLLICNVKSKIQTEMIALFKINSHESKRKRYPSFHYFSG